MSHTPKMSLRARFEASTAVMVSCALLLLLGSALLTSIAGEAGGKHILPWLATLAALTLVWLLSLGSKKSHRFG